MDLLEEAGPLIDERRFDQIEALWMSKLEAGLSPDVDIAAFLELARLLRRSDERTRADALLGLLADSLQEADAWPQRLKLLKELARLAKNPANLRKEIEEAVGKAWGSRPSFRRVAAQVGLGQPAGNPLEKAEKIESWLLFDQGEIFFMPGRGAGVVVELNPDLGICRLDFEKEKRVSIPLGAAPKFLTPLPPGHLLRDKIENPEALQKRAVSDPAGTFAQLLQSFGRAMTVSEVKDAVLGIVPETRWSSWWTAARKNPQIVTFGSGAKATYGWNDSSEQAELSIRRDFAQASPRAMIEIARKHGSRSPQLTRHFAASLSKEAERLARSEPSLAWEIIALIERLPVEVPPPFDPASLIAGSGAARIVAGISDRALRERALDVIQNSQAEWTKIFGELFFMEEDPRILSQIVSRLESGGAAEIRDRLIDETLRYPRRHPRAFYWYCKMISEAEPLPERASYALLWQMVEATGSDEFGALKPRFRELFDRGGLGIRIIMNSDNEEQARKLVETIERYGSIEEYRRETMKAAAHMKYPQLREPQAEPVYATAEAFAAKREELEHLRKVEIPANSKALQTAREMGDLRENFEYKAARQRAEYLSARVGELQSELSRVRLLDPNEIDTSVIRIGTRASLRNGDIQRDVTILGPWESDPEHGVYSNQSEVARALLGRSAGEIVSFMGNDYQIESISRWKS
ncbi:MAG TPA: GreA/GreB family elongation factor [Thermoanaerobaculia bacterium]|nr:GreA/GreB family elongation factor [Thermoanaerobaculia bacterium]